MTKSLLVHSQAGGVFSTATFHNFIGGGPETFTESQTQITATEAVTLSKLRGYKLSGTGASDTVRLRKNGADGNQLLTFGAGEAGYVEDASNTDAIANGDEFNLKFDDVGTDPTYTWIAALIEFTSGHGSIHGAVRSNLTWNPGGRYRAAYGRLNQFSSIPGGQIKNRAYNSLASYQVNIQSNTNTTGNAAFEVRINNVQVSSTVLSISPGLSGIFLVNGLSVALADGDLIHFRSPTVTVDGSIVFNTEIVFLKSTTAKCDLACGDAGGTGSGLSRAASGTPNYFPLGAYVAMTAQTEAQCRVRTGYQGRASNLRINLATNGYTSDATFRLYKNGSPALTVTIPAGVIGWHENSTDTDNFLATDEYSLEIVGGGSGTITIYAMMITLEDTQGTTPTTATSSVTGTATAVGTAVTIGAGDGAATGSGTLTATTGVIVQAQAALTGTGTIASTGTGIKPTTTAVATGAGTLAANGTGLKIATSALTGTGTQAATGFSSAETTSALSGTGTVAGAGVAGIATATGTLAGTGTIAGNGRSIFTATAALTGAGAAVGASTAVGQNLGAQVGTGVVNGKGGSTAAVSAGLTGTGAQVGTGRATAASSAALVGTGTVAAAGALILASTGSQAGIGTVAASGRGVVSATGDLAGTGTVAAAGVSVGVSATTAAVAGTGVIVAQSSKIVAAVAALSGVGTIAAAATGLKITTSAALTGLGTVTGKGSPLVETTGIQFAAGTLIAATKLIGTGSAQITGLGSLVGLGLIAGLVSSVGTAQGKGTVTGHNPDAFLRRVQTLGAMTRTQRGRVNRTQDLRE